MEDSGTAAAGPLRRAAASDGTYAYYFGGYSFTLIQTVDTVYRYDPVADTWTTMAPLPQAEIVAAAVYYPPTNKIYVFGGSDRDAQIVFDLTQIYDIATNTGRWARRCRPRAARWPAATTRRTARST